MKDSHYCVVHQVPFFKKGKMRGYAHPITDDEGRNTGEWCNEPEIESEAPQSKSSPVKEVASSKSSLPEIAPQERGMWWKELGECLRSGEIDVKTPRGLALRVAYYTEMSRVLGIPIKEVQPAKKLIEEAKKLGAKEIIKEDNN